MRFFVIILLSLNLLSTGSIARAGDLQNVDEVIQTLKTSMDKRDARNFSSFFDNTIDLTYSNTHSIYTRSHALVILNDFYNKNHPSSFKVDFKGVSPHSDAQYIIGTATTENGLFRVYLYIKNKDGKPVIQEMKIAR